MELAYPSLTTATISLDCLRPALDCPIEYQVPSTATAQDDSSVRLASSSATSNTLQPSHASQSVTYFPPTGCRGFVKASVINDGFTLELRWLSSIKNSEDDVPETLNLDRQTTGSPPETPIGDEQNIPSDFSPLDQNGCHPPFQFHFSSRIIPTPYLTLDLQDNTLIILVLTENYSLYRLKFAAPHLFYSELFEEDWASDYEVEAILNRHVILCHGIDANNLVVSCSDGILTHLSWGKLIGIDDTFGWKSSNLSTRPSLWGLLPSWSSTKTVSSSAHEWVATPSSTIAITSRIPFGATGEDAWLFTVGRDRKLRTWNLATGTCVRELSLGGRFEVGLNGDSEGLGSDDRRDNSLLPAASRTLARFIYADEGDDPTYEGFLVVFLPSAVSPSFVTYGMLMTSDHRFKDLVLLEERKCDLSHSNPKMGELRDFKISKVDFSLSHTTLPLKHRTWGFWAIWDDDLGGEGLIQYTVLHETRSWQEVPRSKWITITPPDRGTPWNSTYFDEILSNDPSLSITQVFTDHLFKPGHFSTSDLDYALTTYEAQLQAAASHDYRQGSDASAYDTLEEKICALVGSNVRLEISSVTGSPMMDVYHRKLRIEWLKFATMCSESRSSSLWPIELAVDPDRHQVLVIGRRSITAPVLIDTASLLSRITVEEMNGGQPSLLHQEVAEIDHFHPLLSNLHNRVDLGWVFNAINKLVKELPYSEVVKPLEDEITQIVKKPMTFSILEIGEDLFGRRLESFIDDNLQSQVSSRIKSVKDLEMTLQILWTILTTSELVKTPFDEDPQVDLPQYKTTILTQMLLSDLIINSIEARYQLVRNTVVFLLYLYGEEDVDQLFSDFSGLLSKFFLTYHQVYVLRWITQQCAKVSSELAFEVEDNLVDKLTSLHVSKKELCEDGLLMTDASSATSLISSLLLTKFIPELPSTSKLPVSITQAASTFLHLAGFFRNLSSLSDKELGRIKMIQTQSKNVELVNFLLQVGLNNIALEMIDMYPDCGAGLNYLKGQTFLELGKYEDAEDCFVRAACAIYDENFELDDESGLRQVLPPEARTGLSAYFSHIVSLFDSLGIDLAVAKFCQLAIENTTLEPEPDADNEVLELWSKLFKAYVNLGLWDSAYETLISTPSIESQHNNLRTLVSSMCEANEVDKLLHFSFIGLQSEFERTIAFRARNSDPLSVPNYYQILYAYHIGKGDHRSAATAMYHHGRKIGDIAIKANAFQLLMTQQCQSYLAAINALSLAPEKHAWITIACPRSSPSTRNSYSQQSDANLLRNRRRMNYCIPETEFTAGTADVEILTLTDIRQEYTLVLSRLQLANELPQLSHPGSSTSSSACLNGETLIPMFVNQGRVTEAFEKASVLGTDMIPIFVKLVESCCRLTIEGEKDVDVFDQQWVNSDPLGLDWDGTIVNKAWRLLQVHVQHRFPFGRGEVGQKAWMCRESILETILQTDRSIKLPIWLIQQFMNKRPHRLLKLFFKYDLLQDAFTVAIHIVTEANKSIPQDPTSSSGLVGATCLSMNDIDQLLNLTDSDVVNDNDHQEHGVVHDGRMNKSRLRYFQNSLRQILNVRNEMLQKAEKILSGKRQLAAR